ncbi:MAG: restriction endonuclease subunit S [Oscillospiraceae bacterium]|nr:restriction endonuclease subunit S [Oscillospiraceae bacterium]
MQNWKMTTIAECSTLLGDGLHGTPKYDNAGEYAFINGNNLDNGRITIKAETKRVGQSEYEKHKKALTERTVLVSINGTLGNVALYNGEKVILGKSACYFNVAEHCDVQFMRYVVTSPRFRQYINAVATGTTIKNVSLKQMREYTFPIPNLTEQKQIARVLYSLDQKISTNRQINDNLYDLLQSVYQLQFGVTSGNAAEGILSDICSYTKDRIAVSELSLGNYYSTENMLPGKAGFTEATSLPTTPQTTRCNAGDVLVSNIRPYFKKIVLCHSEGGCSTDVLCFAPKAPAYSAYLFCTLYADRFFDFMVAGSKGTKMPRGDKQQIMTYPVYIPTESELTAFADFATPILSQIHGNNEENARLEHLRDTLLPKLMSGEIDVSAIDI